MVAVSCASKPKTDVDAGTEVCFGSDPGWRFPLAGYAVRYLDICSVAGRDCSCLLYAYGVIHDAVEVLEARAPKRACGETRHD